MAVLAAARGREVRAVLTALRAIVRRFSISERADVSCCGMTVAQAAALETLRTEGPLPFGVLGRRLGISPSTLTRNLLRLERRRFVARANDPADARSFRASLTPAGRRAARRVERQNERFARSVLDRLPRERRRAALAGLQALLAAVRGATDSCCPGAFDHLMSEFPRGQSCAGRASR